MIGSDIPRWTPALFIEYSWKRGTLKLSNGAIPAWLCMIHALWCNSYGTCFFKSTMDTHLREWLGCHYLHMPQIAAARQWFQVSRKVCLVVCCVCISLCFWEACFMGGASNTCSWLSTNRCPLCRNHRNETYSMRRLTTRFLFPHSAQDSQDILSITFGHNLGHNSDLDSAKNSLDNFEWCVVFGPSFASDSGLQFFPWRSTFS